MLKTTCSGLKNNLVLININKVKSDSDDDNKVNKSEKRKFVKKKNQKTSKSKILTFSELSFFMAKVRLAFIKLR